MCKNELKHVFQNQIFQLKKTYCKSVLHVCSRIIDSLHPSICIHTYILHTVFHTFTMVLTRRICVAIKGVFYW